MKRIAMLALLLGLLAGCGTGRAASALPEEMPADFEIRYEDWIDADGSTSTTRAKSCCKRIW